MFAPFEDLKPKNISLNARREPAFPELFRYNISAGELVMISLHENVDDIVLK